MTSRQSTVVAEAAVEEDSSDGSVPRVIVTGFDTNPAEVHAGSDFTLTIHLKNTSKKTKVQNMLFELQAPTEGTDEQTSAPAFLPTSGSNSIYLNGIKADGTADISITLNAKADLLQKPYSINLSMKYEDSQATQIESSSSISIPVKQDARFEFSEFEISLRPSRSVVRQMLCAVFIIWEELNCIMQKPDLKAMELKTGDFIGNVDAGATGSIDAMLQGEKVTNGNSKITMTLSYEDESGNISETTKDFELEVTEAVDDSDMYMNTDGDAEAGSSGFPVVPVVVVIVIIAGVVAAVVFVKKKKKKQHRVFWFFIKLQIFLMVLILGGLCFYYFGGYADKVAKLHSEAVELVQKSDKNTFLPARTSTLYDTNGDEISETATTKKADYVKYEDIPQNFVNCMVSIEDKKFYKHNGVDLKAIVRAAKSIIKNKRITQGGSTITMQLARNIYLDTNKNWQRKVKEMFIAMALEKKYSKNDIMEFYLNNVYFMNGYYGIQAACHGYFNCELSDLDLSQTAFLCAIPNSPTYYDPINNKDHTLTRRNLILKNLREDGKITQQEYEAAINEEITLNMPEKDDTVKYNYVDTYAYYCATRALMENEGFKFKYYFDSDDEEKEYDASYDEMYSYCQKKLYSDGYKIYTSIDLTMQQQLQDSIDLTLLDFTDTTDDGTFKLQSAATCIDNDTGEVVAIVGGRSQDAVSHTLNRAFQSHRQPGSSIKPLIVYTPSFERGKTPDTIVNDHKFDGGPSNSGDSYYGDVTIRFAVQKSLNTVAWQLYDELTPKVGLQYLKDMNFTNIVKDDYVTATALGGFTTGVSTLEMASAYSTLENDGMYRNPTCIKSIVDSDNNIIYTSSQKDTVIYTETASRMMTDVMTDVMKSGTGRSANLDNGMPCAGKTGTTNDKKDGWFCGFTRYYTTCVWVGCDMPETVKKLTGSSYPAEIWKNYMDQIHADLTPIDFLPYAQISDDYQDSQDTPADDQTQNNPTDQTVTTPDAGTTTPDKTTTDTNKTDAAGGNHEKTPTTPSENPSGGAGDSGSAGGQVELGDSGSAGDTGGAGDSGSTGGAGGAGGSGSTGGAGGAGGSGSTGGTGGATGGTTGGEAAQ